MQNFDWRCKFSTVSRLDSFAQYLTGYLHNYGENPPEFTNEIFVNQLLKLQPPSLAMEAGSALHKIVENAEYNELPNKIVVDSWTINCPDDLNIIISYPYCREIPLTYSFDNITIFGKVDAIDSNNIHDLKITSSINMDRYNKSWQWKTYLTMANMERFVYDLLKVNIDEKNKIINIKEYDKLVLYAYPNMQMEVKEFILDYWYFLESIKDLIIEKAIANNVKIKGISDTLFN